MNYLLGNAATLLAGTSPSWLVWVILGVLVVLCFVWFFVSGRKNKQRQKEYMDQLDAIAPGNKVKTAGGICGIVVEVCDDNTVIIKTGSEQSGYSFVKMEKDLIAQTDAKSPMQLARDEAEARRKAEAEKEVENREKEFNELFDKKSEDAEEPAKTEESAEPAEAPAEEKAAEPESKEGETAKAEEAKDKD